MHRSVLTCAFLVLATAAFAQQQQQQTTAPNPYEGQSHPPADDNIVVTPPPDQPAPKPQAGKPKAPDQVQPYPDSAALQRQLAPSTAAEPTTDASDTDGNGTDNGTVGVARPVPAQPALMSRDAYNDPDGDIVHPHPVGPGQLADGTTIRVHLLTALSTGQSHAGEVFRTQVASDVLQDGQVLIPAGAEIDGRVVQVASGTARSHGTMLLRPETVILPDGSRYHMDAQVTGTPGSKTHVSSEGFIDPGARYKKDGIEYGGAVGTGVVTGALVAGPVGALTGGIIGAGAITVHLLTDHSEATLQPGTVLLFTLDNRLDLQAANPTVN